MKKSKSLGRALLWVLLFIGVQIIISVAVMAGGSAFGGTDINTMLSGTVPVVLVLCNIATSVLTLLIVKLSGGDWAGTLGLRKPSFAGLIVPLLFAAALAPLIGYALELIPVPESALGDYEQLMDMAITDSRLSALAVTLFAPICEELIFRGAIFSVLQKSFSKTFSVVFTAFLFGLVHFNPIQSSYAFVLGIILCLLCLRFRSLWASVAAHVAFNIIGGYIDTSVFSEISKTALLIGCAAVSAALAVWMLFYKKRKA